MTSVKVGRKRVSGDGTYQFVKPGVTLPCEKLTPEEIKKLSGPVRRYHVSQLKEMEGRKQ